MSDVAEHLTDELFKAGLKRFQTSIDVAGNIKIPKVLTPSNKFLIATDDPDTMIEISFRLVSKKSG